jgi:hypothetical protein
VKFARGVGTVTDSAATRGDLGAVGDGAALGAGCCALGALVAGAPLTADVFGVAGVGVVTAVVSALGADERDDGNRIGVTMNTTAISTSARMVRLSMQGKVKCYGVLWDRVVPARPKWVATRDTSQREPSAPQRPMAFERLDGVCGAAWIIAARGGQQWR